MTDARMKSFFDKMVASGVVKAGIDYQEGLQPAIREQGRGRRSAAEMIEHASCKDERRDD